MDFEFDLFPPTLSSDRSEDEILAFRFPSESTLRPVQSAWRFVFSGSASDRGANTVNYRGAAAMFYYPRNRHPWSEEELLLAIDTRARGKDEVVVTCVLTAREGEAGLGIQAHKPRRNDWDIRLHSIKSIRGPWCKRPCCRLGEL
jgi:hypothetical protein